MRSAFAFLPTLALLVALPCVAIPSHALAGRYIPGEVLRVGVRNAGMGGNHVALRGDLSAAMTNPATILLPQDATQFGGEGYVQSGPDFVTRGGDNDIDQQQQSPPLLLGFTTTFKEDFAFSIVDALRYNGRFSGRVLSSDDPDAVVTDYFEDIRMNSMGLSIAARILPRWCVGLGLFYDRQKVFKTVDYETFSVETRDYEAFGTSTALHGTIGLLWEKSPRSAWGLSFITGSDFTNNLTLHEFVDNINPTPNNPNNFFDLSRPVSTDKFPWSVSVGGLRRLSPTADLLLDASYASWDGDPNRKGIVSLSAGGEWRFHQDVAARAGVFTQPEASDYSTTATLDDEDLHIVDLRGATSSSYSIENNEVFLTGGLGVTAGAFRIDLSVEDSHLFTDYGRTYLKLGISGLLASKPGAGG